MRALPVLDQSTLVSYPTLLPLPLPLLVVEMLIWIEPEARHPLGLSIRALHPCHPGPPYLHAVCPSREGEKED